VGPGDGSRREAPEDPGSDEAGAGQRTKATCGPAERGLVLTLTTELTQDGRSLRLTAKNCGPRPVAFLHHAMLQPSKLAVSEVRTGAVVSFSDSRAIAKYDNTVRASAFVELPAGEARLLFETWLVDESSEQRLRWGPFDFEPMKPGAYRLVATFASKHRSGQDEDGRVVTIPNAWTGSVVSPPLVLTLP
jgi:hypothetical protein